MTNDTIAHAQLSMDELENVNGGILPLVAFAAGFYIGFEIGLHLK